MLNRFFVTEAQKAFSALQCVGEARECGIARTTEELEPIKTDAELEAYEHVLAPIACRACIDCIQENFENSGN